MYKRLFQLSIFLISLEFLLRLFSVNETYSEKLTGNYQYFYKQQKPSWFLVWSPNSSFEHHQEEFNYLNHYNDLGHREIDFSDFQKDSSAIKIVCLGDSFTEGDGTPYDSSWVRFFESNIRNALDTNVLCYNAGVCGSDVFYNGVMLKEKLIQAKPSVVIECVNKSDITDIYYRGGKERFNEDGTLNSPNEKWWEPLYKYSYTFRIVIVSLGPYDKNLINQWTLDRDELQSLNMMSAKISETYQLCKSHNISYCLILMPLPSDANFRTKVAFQTLPELLPKDIPVINLFPSFYSAFDTLDIRAYSWEKNGHYNGRGYQLMGEQISNIFLQKGINNQSL